MCAAIRAGFYLRKGKGLVLAGPAKHLNHAADGTAAIDRRHIAAYHLDPLHLVEHDVLQADGSGAVLLGQGNPIEQHQHLHRRAAAKKQAGGGSAPTALAELEASLACQQRGQVQCLRALDVLPAYDRRMRQRFAQQLGRTAGADHDQLQRILGVRQARPCERRSQSSGSNEHGHATASDTKFQHGRTPAKRPLPSSPTALGVTEPRKRRSTLLAGIRAGGATSIAFPSACSGRSVAVMEAESCDSSTYRCGGSAG